jgi:hypothetical protein
MRLPLIGRLLICVIAPVFGAGLVRADIIYDVDDTGFGIDGGTATGSIETNGTIGTLDSGDFVTWNLLLSDGIGDSFTINPGNSSITMTGTATTATANLLQFNFDTPPSNAGDLGYFEILDTTAGWGLQYAVPPNTPLAIIDNPDDAFTAGLLSFSPQPVTIGATPIAATPEPSAFLFLASGLGIMATIRAARRSRR